jgi:hypothetical protein
MAVGMWRSGRELWAAFIALIAISTVYLFVVVYFGSIPGASGFFGHSLGILGFILMLMTETLYSLRKRTRQARWGKMSSWLQFHIFTGIVGPYLVLLHSSWKFNGLAGVLTLLTGVIVLSGFVGRYLFTSIPRTVDGAAMEFGELERIIQSTEEELRALLQTRPELASLQMATSRVPSPRHGGELRLVLGRGIDDLRHRLRWWRARRHMPVDVRAPAARFEALLKRRRTLERQGATLVLARRLLSLWHAVHIPIGITLFGVAFIHIMAAIYYATLWN